MSRRTVKIMALVKSSNKDVVVILAKSGAAMIPFPCVDDVSELKEQGKIKQLLVLVLFFNTKSILSLELPTVGL